jgi:hypothetical protein
VLELNLERLLVCTLLTGQNSAEAIPAFSLGSHGERARLVNPSITREMH